jgi:hypothetical protein
MSQHSDIVFHSEDVDVEAKTVHLADPGETPTIDLSANLADIAAGGNESHGTVKLSNGSGTEQIRAGAGSTLGTVTLGDGETSRRVMLTSDGFAKFGGDEAYGKLHVNDVGGNIIVKAESSSQTLTIRDRFGADTVQLDGSSGQAFVGGGTSDEPGHDGTLEVLTRTGATSVEVNGSNPTQTFYDEGDETISFSGRVGTIFAGSPNHDGAVELRSDTYSSGSGHNTVRLDAEDARLSMTEADGTNSSEESVRLTSSATFELGGSNRPADVRLSDTGGDPRVQILGGKNTVRSQSAVSGTVRLFVDGAAARMALGGNGRAGNFAVLDSNDVTVSRWTLGSLRLGGGTQANPGKPGFVSVENNEGVPVAELQGDKGTLTVGGALGSQRQQKKKSSSTRTQKGEPGDISVQHDDGTEQVHVESSANGGRVELADSSGATVATLEVNGSYLSILDSGGTEALRIESGGVVKTANPVQRI